MKNKGFTLIELMIVVAIIAILAAVAAPKFGQQIMKSKDAKGLSLVGNWRSASQLYYSDQGDYATKMGDLVNQVDDTTIKGTYSDTGLTTLITNALNGSAYIGVGTAEVSGVNNKYIELLYTTDGTIAITSSGVDTQNKNWSDK